MKTQLLILGLLMGACGNQIDHLATAIDNANKKSSTDTATDTATAANTKTGSRTVTKSVTTTVSESGDQSVFTDSQTATSPASSPAPVVAPKVKSPIVGSWMISCDDGIAWKKEFGSNGVLKVTTYVYDNPSCDASVKQPQVFVQQTKYTADDEVVVIANDQPISINVDGNNNTIVLGNQVLEKQ
jgi:hypothetical protein